MIEKKDLQTIKIVQGDTLTATFTIEDLQDYDIKEATFVCKELGIYIPLIKVDDDSDDSTDTYWNDNDIPDSRWLLWWTGNTEDLRVGTFKYDFTIATNDDPEQVVTFVYNGTLIIKPKFLARDLGYRQYWDYPHNTKREH